ncbi:MAG: iron transporter [Thermomicrobiales bacterium]
MEPSNEATEEQLQHARAQGLALQGAISAMEKETGELKTVYVGDYEVAVTAEEAEGLYHFRNGNLEWVEPTEENCHIEVGVRDASDGRFIPGLNVSVNVSTSDGEDVGTHEHPFLWHPWLYHYGRNWHVPRSGEYRIMVHIDPPTFMRHDIKNGKRYADPVDAEFQISIETGQKISTD